MIDQKRKSHFVFRILLFASFFSGLVIGLGGIYLYITIHTETPNNQQTSKTIKDTSKRKKKKTKNYSDYLDPAVFDTDTDNNEGASYQKLMDRITQDSIRILSYLTDTKTDSNSLKLIGKENYEWDNQEEQIAKEWLISVWKYKIEQSEGANLADSLLIEGIIKNKNILLIEFWHSPMNYSGYRYQPGKLTLFGVSKPDKADFIFKKEILILTYDKINYTLIETDDFIPLPFTKK